jgi:hypothetical protein
MHFLSACHVHSLGSPPVVSLVDDVLMPGSDSTLLAMSLTGRYFDHHLWTINQDAFKGKIVRLKGVNAQTSTTIFSNVSAHFDMLYPSDSAA